MDMILDALSWICLSAGSVLILIGAVGILRLPDMFARMHSAGIIDTLGALLILLGCAFQTSESIVFIKLFLIVAFILYTSPVATHALARAALNDGLKPQTADDSGEKETGA